MIICQPKKPVVYLISILLITSFFLIGAWMYNIIGSPAPSFISLLIACLMLSLLLYLAVRLMVSYVKILAGDNKLTIRYTLMGKAKTYPLNSMTSVEEVKINTFQNKQFRQLIINFGGEKISLNNQVYTGYDSLKSYLNQKKPGSKNKFSKR